MIHDRLKKLLEYSKLSQNKFASKIGVDKGLMSRIMKGESGFGYETLERIVNEFPEVSCEWILRGKGEMLSKNNDFKNIEELKEEITWLKTQLSKSLSVSESKTNLEEQALKYQRDIIDIYKILSEAGIDIDELVKTNTRRAI